MYFKCLAASLSVFSLVACGGGSSGNAVGAASFRSLTSELGQAEDFLEETDLTRANQIPTSGTARYNGVISVFEAAGPSALDADRISYSTVGEMAVTANFRNGAVSGSASNFYEVRNPNAASAGQLQSAGQIAGTLTLDAAINSGLVEGEMEGRLIKTSGAATNYDLDVVGFFLGDQADAILAFGEGQGTSGNRSTSAGAIFVVN